MEPKPTILLVDDDEEIRTQLKWGLADTYTIKQAADRAEAIAMYKEHSPTVTLLDLGLPPHPNSPEEGMAALASILALDPSARIVIASGQGDKENGLRAIGSGAVDFLVKPVDIEEVRHVVKRCVNVAELESKYQEAQARLAPKSFEGILAESDEMQTVFKMVKKVAKSMAPVLVLGESGTGKEMAAGAVHAQSDRKKGPFIAINCNAIPENLIESELFGHEKGSFTGATAQRKGLIETAAGGTLFLDEIGELPAPIQVKLLRFLQEKKLQRVGGREEYTIDTRIVAATNADLKDAIKEGTFREDLYFRLAVVVLTLPPLRDRGEDVLLLANAFLESYGEENGKAGRVFSPASLRAILKHTWPGNVRELQNRVQRAVLMADSKRVSPEDLELEDEAGDLPVTTLKEAREHLERRMTEAALSRNTGNVSAAAVELGVSRPTLYELMDKLGIHRPKKATSRNPTAKSADLA